MLVWAAVVVAAAVAVKLVPFTAPEAVTAPTVSAERPPLVQVDESGRVIVPVNVGDASGA
jgi:hypothetical protein